MELKDVKLQLFELKQRPYSYSVIEEGKPVLVEDTEVHFTIEATVPGGRSVTLIGGRGGGLPEDAVELLRAIEKALKEPT